MRRPGRAGFTLVELLLAATVIAILFVGLGAHLRGGITVWRRTTQTGEQLQRQRVALKRLERDLANALIYDAREESYGDDLGLLPQPSFGEDALAWFAVVPAASPASAVRFLRYACGAVGDATGLWRTNQSIGEARAKDEPVRELLLPDCEELAIQYAPKPPSPDEPLVWGPWGSDLASGLPRLVEVTITFASGSRTVHTFGIPAGHGQPSGEPLV